MQVDAVEQGTGNLVAIVLDLRRPATAFPFGVAIIPAGAGVHCQTTT